MALLLKIVFRFHCNPNRIFNVSKCRLFSTKNHLIDVLKQKKTIAFKHELESQNLTKVGFNIAPKCKNESTVLRHYWSRNFHTTKPNNVPPIIWVVLRPIGKLAAVITGRRLRKWWKNLPDDKREAIKQLIRENKTRILLVLSALVALLYVYYWTHLQETPITGRIRFVTFTRKQFEEIAEFEGNMLMSQVKEHLLPKHHPKSKMIENVALRILKSNNDLKEIYDKKWSICVIDDPKANAFVLPTGQIFVFTGIFNIVSNDDQLATVIAHEMSHAILEHGAELLSFAQFLDIFVVLGFCLLWTVIPVDIFAGFSSWMYHKLLDIALSLPYNRKLETEADEVGLQLAAKACFDVRESVVFWRKMSLSDKATFQETLGNDTDLPNVEFLSTHPSHESRAEVIESLLSRALDTREKCKCPKLPKVDPREVFEREKQVIKSKRNENENVLVLSLPPPRPAGV